MITKLRPLENGLKFFGLKILTRKGLQTLNIKILREFKFGVNFVTNDFDKYIFKNNSNSNCALKFAGLFFNLHSVETFLLQMNKTGLIMTNFY